MNQIHPQAESFLLRGSDDTACLFIHGFTASPSEVYPVAQIIHELSGYTVSGPLLPGHGCTPQAMNQTSWQDWWDWTEQELSILKSQHERVFVAGLSMGGLLALYTGSRSASVDGIIAINTPIFTTSPRLVSLAPLLQYLRPYYPKKIDLRTLELEARGRFAYPVMPVKALLSMQYLRKLVVRELPTLDLPILIFQSRDDETVNPRSAHFIKDMVAGDQVKLIELHNSGHIATMSPDQKIIAEEIINFIGQPI